jgi:hypothetical protein
VKWGASDHKSVRNIEAIVNRTVEMIAQGREDDRKESGSMLELLKWNYDVVRRMESQSTAMFELWTRVYQERCYKWGE